MGWGERQREIVFPVEFTTCLDVRSTFKHGGFSVAHEYKKIHYMRASFRYLTRSCHFQGGRNIRLARTVTLPHVREQSLASGASGP